MERNQPTTHRVASTQGIDLALHHFGGSGPPLLICHATGFHAHCYSPMLPRLTKNFDVWAVDFRGHGASSAPEIGPEFTWDGYADDVLASLAFMDKGPARVFGHSMGCVATLLAEKQAPGSIDSAWFFEPIVFPETVDVPRNSAMADGAAKRRAEFDSKAEALLRYASRPPLGIFRADVLAAYVTHGFHETDSGSVTLACSPELEAATFRSAATYAPAIQGLALNAVIAGGMQGADPSPADWVDATAAALPNATSARYDGLTHFGPFQDPDLFAADVTAFLAK